jgi:hypothetical protein
MKRLDIRNSFIALGTISIVLAACSGGGGGSSTTPALVGNPNVNVTAQPGQQVNNVGGPTAPMSITIRIPQRPQLSAAIRAKLHKQYGPKHADAHIRSIANTSPTASIRTAGQAINRAAAAAEGRRGAQYVGSQTSEMEFILSTGSGIAYDSLYPCSNVSGTCTGVFNVPLGTYTASLLLYDDCGYLLSAGSTAGVVVTAGTNSPLTISLDGVVAYFDVETNASTPFIADASEAQSFSVTVTPADADYNQITTPGTLIDESLTVIGGVSISHDPSLSPDVSPSTSPTLMPIPAGPSPLPSATPVACTGATVCTFSFAETFTFYGTGTESNVNFTSTYFTTGSPIVPFLGSAGGAYGYGVSTGVICCENTYKPSGTLSIQNVPVQLIITNPMGLPNPQGSPGYYINSSGQIFDPQFAQVYGSQGNGLDSGGLWLIEFPGLMNAGPGTFGFQEVTVSQSPLPIPFNGNITFSDNGLCSGVLAYPSSAPYASPDPNYGKEVTLNAYNLSSPNPGSNNTPCIMTGTDSSTQGRAASLAVLYDSSTLTIQNHARARSAK